MLASETWSLEAIYVSVSRYQSPSTVCIGLPKMLEFPLHGPWLGVQCIHILWNRSHNTLINISTLYHTVDCLRSFLSSGHLGLIGHLGHRGHTSGLFVFMSSCHHFISTCPLTKERTNKQTDKQH